jgi:DNA ligase 1
MGPTKKRKKNSDGSSLQATRNLDYFFSKEKKNTLPTGAHKEQRLTDEELARKLHKQWNREETQLDHRHENPLDTKGRDDEGEEYENNTPGFPVFSTIKSTPKTSQRASLSLQPISSTEDAVSSTIPFVEDALDFTPSKYIPELQKQWENEGGDASYALLTRCFVLVNSTRSRIKIVDTLVNFLRTIIEGDPGSLLASVSKFSEFIFI